MVSGDFRDAAGHVQRGGARCLRARHGRARGGDGKLPRRRAAAVDYSGSEQRLESGGADGHCGRVRPLAAAASRLNDNRSPGSILNFPPKRKHATYHAAQKGKASMSTPGAASQDAANIKPATGKLGIMTAGMGAVCTTLIAGVEAVRKGLAKPIGSLTQMGTIRLGKRTDANSPLIRDFVPLAKLDDLVFTGWDIFGGNLDDVRNATP